MNTEWKVKEGEDGRLIQTLGNKAWRISTKEARMFIYKQSRAMFNIYDYFQFELQYKAGGWVHIRENGGGERKRLPKFPKYITERLNEFTIRTFIHTDGKEYSF